MFSDFLPDKSTFKLMRIPFSYFLMPVFLFALSQVRNIDVKNAIVSFLVLHLFIYPASNGYNSYMDKDETSIGGLKNPPKPTKKLFYLSALFDSIGLILSLTVNVRFFCCVLAYMLASRAYSSKAIRLKKMPIMGFLTVVFFQGAFTFWMIYSNISKDAIEYTQGLISAIAGCSFLIAGVYPLTQVYQHETDFANGDITISYKLGYNGTFIFTASMFICASLLFFYYFSSIQKEMHFMIFQAFLLPVVIYFIAWFFKVMKDTKQASFERTMKMNLIASTCMTLCFITLLILDQSK